MYTMYKVRGTHMLRLKTAALAALLITTAHAQTALPITGDWSGALSVGGAQAPPVPAP